MTKEVIMYKCVCDNCGSTIVFGEGWSVFSEEDLQSWIDNEEYTMKVIDGKHICYKCIEINEQD